MLAHILPPAIPIPLNVCERRLEVITVATDIYARLPVCGARLSVRYGGKSYILFWAVRLSLRRNLYI